jgi:ABC-type nitrate/sulfonate/bicarbonate transport system substrate-binding protein
MEARKKGVREIGLPFILALCLIGVNLNSSNAAELRKIKFATLAATTQPIFFVAQDKGFLAEEGIDVDIEKVTSGTSMVIEIVAAGQVDIGVCAPGATMLAIEKGVPIKLVGAFEYQFIDKQGRSWDGALLVCEDSDSYKKLEDLKGKKIAVGGIGSIYNQSLRYQLRKRGLDPDTSVTIIPMSYTQMQSALVKRQVDAAFMLPPTYVMAKKDIPLKILMEGTRVSEMNIDLSAGIGVNEKFAQKNPDIVVKFIKALIKSELFIVKDIKETNGEYVKNSVQKRMKYKPEYLEAWYTYRGSYGREWDFVNPIQVPSSIIPKLSDIFISEKLLKKPLTPEKVIDNSFIKKAYAELGMKWDDKKGR